jgi:hypothetical protein
LQGSCCIANFLFFPLSERAGGHGSLLQSQWGVLGPCALWMAGQPSKLPLSGRSWDCSFCTEVMWLSCREAQCEVQASVYPGERRFLVPPAEQ